MWLRVLSLLQSELSEDPKDVVANFIVRLAQGYSVHSQYFFGFYLVLHGLVKIFVIVALLKNKMWAYPTAIVVFLFFISYELYRFFVTHSLLILAISIFDMILVGLITHEYFFQKKKRLLSRGEGI